MRKSDWRKDFLMKVKRKRIGNKKEELTDTNDDLTNTTYQINYKQKQTRVNQLTEQLSGN